MEERQEEEKSNDSKPKFNLRCISTWNCWGIPFGSRKIFHKTKKWRAFNDEHLLKAIKSDASIDLNKDLIISCFQETWSMHSGPFMKCFANSSEEEWTPWKETVILTLSAIIFPAICCFKFVYDAPQRTMDNKAEDIDKQVPFKSVSGSKGMSLSRLKPIDSGLCILSTWKPEKQGFIPFQHTKWNKGVSKDEEALANKGMLWAYYVNKDKTCGTLVINTHTTTSTKVQYHQNEEIKAAHHQLVNKFMDLTKHFEFYLAGDFNSELKEEQLNGLMTELNLRHISTEKQTNGPQTRCIDHIFTWRKEVNEDKVKMEHKVSELMKPWESDCNACPETQESLSDHVWQCVTIGLSNEDNVEIDLEIAE